MVEPKKETPSIFETVQRCYNVVCNGATTVRVEIGDWEATTARREGVLGF
jgi:hypothetical protein